MCLDVQAHEDVNFKLWQGMKCVLFCLESRIHNDMTTLPESG